MKSNKKQTIFFSTYDDIKNPHYGGGGAIAVHEVAKRLVQNYDVHVLSWDYSGRKKEIIDGVIYERFGLSFLSPKVAMFVYQLTLPFVSSGKDYDIWMESFCPPFTTAFFPLFVKKPVVGIVHMLAAEDMERKYKLPFHIIQNTGIRTYKNIIVTSEIMRKKVHKIHPSAHLSLISNGITEIHKPVSKKENYILFLGRIEVDQKGIDLLIAAFKKFVSRNKEYKLVIAGNGDSKEIEKMKEIIKKEDLEKDIILKGKVSGKIKNILVQKAACIVVPSRFETYSLVALEAMAYGAPIVSFDIEGLRWIPQRIAKKVRPFDIAQLSKIISTVISDGKLSSNMIKEGNIYAKQFTWDTIAKEYDTYIKNLI